MSWRIVSINELPDTTADEDWEEIVEVLPGLPMNRAIEVTCEGSPQSVTARVSAWAIEQGLAGTYRTRRAGNKVFIHKGH